jgi:hypothetical protein
MFGETNERSRRSPTSPRFDLPAAIDDALLLVRERAGRRGITLECHVDQRLAEIRADQRKVKQVLLNFLSNAVKFTPEGGRIDVRAELVNGTAEISVTDTGIGIAPENQEAVFEEFRQVGKADAGNEWPRVRLSYVAGEWNDRPSTPARRDRNIVAVGYLLGVGAGVSPTLKIFAPTASSTRAFRTRKRLTP